MEQIYKCSNLILWKKFYVQYMHSVALVRTSGRRAGEFLSHALCPRLTERLHPYRFDCSYSCSSHGQQVVSQKCHLFQAPFICGFFHAIVSGQMLYIPLGGFSVLALSVFLILGGLIPCARWLVNNIRKMSLLSNTFKQGFDDQTSSRRDNLLMMLPFLLKLLEKEDMISLENLLWTTYCRRQSIKNSRTMNRSNKLFTTSNRLVISGQRAVHSTTHFALAPCCLQRV